MSRVVLTTDRAPATATDVAVSVETEVVAEVAEVAGVAGVAGVADVAETEKVDAEVLEAEAAEAGAVEAEAAIGLACVSAVGAPDGPAAGTCVGTGAEAFGSPLAASAFGTSTGSAAASVPLSCAPPPCATAVPAGEATERVPAPRVPRLRR